MRMDFAFVPGIGDAGLERLAALLNRLPDTVTTLTPQPTALSDFLSAADTAVQVMSLGPPGNLLIGAHGTEEGDWLVALDGSTAVPANYETINQSTSIRLPNSLNGPQTWVRLKSCLLGSVQPILVVLKKALGNPAALTAPRYLHAHLNGYLGGIWEFMEYQFVVVGPDSGKSPLASRDIAKGAFSDSANGFQLVDTTSVAPQVWEDWIPPAASLSLAPAKASKAEAPFVVTIPNFFGGGVPAVLLLRSVLHSTLETVPIVPLENDFIPAGKDLQRDTLNDLLGARTEYQASHPYPVYTRYGHKTLTDFTNGFNWAMTYSSGTTKQYSLQYVGTRYRYRLEVPITKPGTNQLIYNFYPDSGTPIVNFSETNDPFNMFGKV
jgi:hypothetical protein